jgi:uncharacterized repeat protein (TIGR01451 family)
MLTICRVLSKSTYSITCANVALCLIFLTSGCGSSLTGESVTTNPPPAPNPVPNLVANVSHSENFVAGEQGATYTVTIVNNGPGPTDTTTTTVTDMIPVGLTLVSMTGDGWSCAANSCIRGEALAAGRSYQPIIVTVNVASSALPSVTNQVSVSGGGSASATSADPTMIDPAPSQPALLSVSLNHKGDFSPGQAYGHFTVTISNLGPTTTFGIVTVTIANGAVSGEGWSCSSPQGTEICTRSDRLAPQQSYPPIISSVYVGTNASSPVVNSVQVTGGNSAPASASDSADVGGPNSCTSLPSGNESLMKGQYAAVAQGWRGKVSTTPNVMAFSVALDGTGKIKDLGGGIGGDIDLNSAITGSQRFTISSSGSFYTVGPDGDPVINGQGAGYVGCMRLQTSGGAFTFTFGLGGIVGSVSTKGAVLQINDESGTNSFVSGQFRMQDSAAFGSGNTNALHTNYVFGEHGGDPSGRYAIAGSFALNPATGTISSFTADQNTVGTFSNITGIGAIGPVSSMDGRAVSFLTVQTSSGAKYTNVLYIVNANEIFIVGADAFSPGSPVRSGQAVVSDTSLTASSIAGNQIVHTTGQGFCSANSVPAPCANAALGLLNFTPNSPTAGTFTGTIFHYDSQSSLGSTTFALGSPGTYTLAGSTGRMTVGNASANLSVLYISSPASNSEPVTFFIVGTDNAASFGYGEQGANAAIATNDILSKSFIVANDDIGDSSGYAMFGTIDYYATGGSWDYIFDDRQWLGAWADDYVNPLQITNVDPNKNPAPGVGTAGSGFVAITNGKRILCLSGGNGPFSKATTKSPAILLIADPQ